MFLYDKVLLPLSEGISRITRNRMIGKNLIVIARIPDTVPAGMSQD